MTPPVKCMVPTRPDQRTTTIPEPPECRYERLWNESGRPDLTSFLASAGDLSPPELAAVLCVDQRLRWASGERPIARIYMDSHAAVVGDAAAAVDLVFNEYLLRERFGPPPDYAEFARRYPAQATELETQLAFHAAVGGAGIGGESGATWTPGRLIGRYRLVRPLGKGGMGTVFLAEDAELGRQVAIKVPHSAAWGDPVGEARFIREAQAAAAIRHPHLCPIYDFGRAAGRCFFTMPFLPGETLRDRLAAGRPDPQTAIDWIVKVARAVAALHRAGLVHRDLKPANIAFDEHDEPVVMDFGLVRSNVPADERLTGSGVVLGTPAYMPPEAVGGTQAGPVGDVYSLGVILYEMLAGRLPFRGTASEMMAARLTQDSPRPSSARRDLGTRFDAICAHALARRPGNRYPTMDAFADDLEAVVRRSTPIRRRQPLWRALVGVIAIVAAIALVIYLRRPDVERHPVPDAPAPAGVVADGFTAGAVWVGEYRFREFNDTADIRLEVTDRTGNTFHGRYLTKGGEFEWLVEATINGADVQWRFTQAVRGDPGGKSSLVAGANAGGAHVIGTVNSGRFVGLFEYTNGGTPADVTLAPVR
jgi:hypothetical protein